MIVLDTLTLVIGALGAAIITWGVAVTLVRWSLFELRHLRTLGPCRRRESIRHQLGSYLLLGLEFLIAADVIATIRDPTLEEVAILASIVLIRTVISFFLNRELSDLEV